MTYYHGTKWMVVPIFQLKKGKSVTILKDRYNYILYWNLSKVNQQKNRNLFHQMNLSN